MASAPVDDHQSIGTLTTGESYPIENPQRSLRLLRVDAEPSKPV
ncbi:MAG: hypothetical protein P1U85_13190 [Verrucomicrobiales bacterium]|nr:hypothetical protein [Verrucomicrobiales bacterium]